MELIAIVTGLAIIEYMDPLYDRSGQLKFRRIDSGLREFSLYPSLYLRVGGPSSMLGFNDPDGVTRQGSLE